MNADKPILDVITLCVKKYLNGSGSHKENSHQFEPFDETKSDDLVNILKKIWQESNDSLRLNWLREREGEMQAPLLFELGLAEFRCDPKEETLHEKTLPLFTLGMFRAWSDEHCITSTPCAFYQLRAIYDTALEQLVGKHRGPIFNPGKVDIHKFKQKVEKSVRLSLEQELPSPIWIARDQKFESQENLAELEAHWDKTRSYCAHIALEKLINLTDITHIDSLF